MSPVKGTVLLPFQIYTKEIPRRKNRRRITANVSIHGIANKGHANDVYTAKQKRQL